VLAIVHSAEPSSRTSSGRTSRKFLATLCTHAKKLTTEFGDTFVIEVISGQNAIYWTKHLKSLLAQLVFFIKPKKISKIVVKFAKKRKKEEKIMLLNF
jgi:hypothetical protein